ncbi:MAG: ABC transporter ATP-binding protein NatA [Alphaproteobacteria bacterium MarineAlpha6_Bin3]|nr:MAG: ABC transporter ATP-binding protein NatA [Alphaproteobacteria bacterium MarineAlpha6_Bin3]|tara:strand:- start:1340 stop:2068 length:729 start_codon:yes stop_codon:yes gene_type:complete
MESSALDITKLNHNFGDLKALSDINISLKKGDYSILLGLNGAGKTTLFSLITRLYDNQTGSIEIFSHNIKTNPSKALANIGVVFQQPTVDLDLTVEQNLQYHASLHGMKKTLALENALSELKRQKMENVLKKKVRELSGGQKRRVEIVRALMHNPKLLLLDEPTVGVDIESRKLIVEHVKTLCSENKLAVLWATHLIDEVDEKGKLIVLDKGKILANDNVKNILKKTKAKNISNAFDYYTKK